MFQPPNPPYRPDLKDRASSLRKNSTLSEVLLWEKLKGRQLLGYKFRRQTMVFRFIVDFYCKELRLAIEIDGISHDEKMEYDILRQKKIEETGIKFLRFSDLDVKKDIDNVIQRIVDWIEAKAN